MVQLWPRGWLQLIFLTTNRKLLDSEPRKYTDIRYTEECKTSHLGSLLTYVQKINTFRVVEFTRKENAKGPSFGQTLFIAISFIHPSEFCEPFQYNENILQVYAF